MSLEWRASKNVWRNSEPDMATIVRKHGPWSAMSIRLSDTEHTRAPAVDYRLKRLLQTAEDTVGKPLSECRVLDLACLEGHYGLEFALHGAEVVAIEIREANLAKAAYAAERLKLDNFSLYQDDVRNLTRERYGVFDIVICSGILYHLAARDARDLVRNAFDCCSRISLFDTYVALRRDQEIEIDGRRHYGLAYKEHPSGASAKEKEVDLWASIDNEESFWFTHESLVNIFAEAGFTSCMDVALPTHPELTFDRRTYLAIRGRPSSILSSDMTARQPHQPGGHQDPSKMHPQNLKHGPVFRAMKAVLPQPVKDAIKPPMRRLGLLRTVDGQFAARKRDANRAT
jgi:predicted RNA methylase